MTQIEESSDYSRWVGCGVFWQEVTVGQQWRTFRRTLTETDLVNFVALSGMTEAIFIDAEFTEGAIQGRPVPAALVYSAIEGLVVQAMLQGTGLALLEVQQQILAPVRVGDTIHATVELTGLRQTSKSGRAITTWSNAVYNSRGENVMNYTAKRMLAGRN